MARIFHVTSPRSSLSPFSLCLRHRHLHLLLLCVLCIGSGISRSDARARARSTSSLPSSPHFIHPRKPIHSSIHRRHIAAFLLPFLPSEPGSSAAACGLFGFCLHFLLDLLVFAFVGCGLCFRFFLAWIFRGAWAFGLIRLLSAGAKDRNGGSQVCLPLPGTRTALRAAVRLPSTSSSTRLSPSSWLLSAGPPCGSPPSIQSRAASSEE